VLGVTADETSRCALDHFECAPGYGASTMICTPASLDQEVGLALGAQAGEERLSEVRRATETPFNLNLEARP
jgi:hypothetical protein